MREDSADSGVAVEKEPKWYGILVIRKHVHNSLEITVGSSIFRREQRKRDVILYIGESHAKPYRAARLEYERQ